MSDNNQNYAHLKELECSDEYKRYIHGHEHGLYIDIDSLIAQKEDMNDSLKDALFALKNHSFEIFQNGLGYNNLLFISAVLGDMSFEKSGIYANLFLVEEPEAHLHPQLQELVLNFFSKKVQQHENIQVIMTSHSPTMVSKIGIKNINLLYETHHKLYNYPLVKASLTDEENDYLEKYLDVTKSQLFFAKGVIFVEGISEAILVPEFAKLIERPLDMYAVELVNINGVGFAPFTKMIKTPNQNTGFAKASIITDDDRCSNKKDSTYISNDLDFDDDLTGIIDKLERGTPSDDVSEIMAYNQWRQVVIEVLVKLPSAADPCGKWAPDAVLSLQEVLTSHSIALLNGAAISDVIKIKVRDSKNPNFKQIPVKEFFEVKIQNEYTYSSVHGVKGESFDAILLYIPGTRGSTLTPSFLASGDTNTELMRIAYVAMTRPRKLLAVAMPKNSVNLSVRFPPSTWDYIEL